MGDSQKGLLTVTETARALKVRSQTVYALLRDGVLAGEKNGRDWSISSVEIERYKERRRLQRKATHRTFAGRAIDVQASSA